MNYITNRATSINEQMNDVFPPVAIPEGEVGTAKITHFEISEDEAHFSNLRMAFSGQSHRALAPGKYTRLVADGRLQMTDTPAEKLDHRSVVRKATGECLVMGLGLGMVAQAMAAKPEVTRIDVVERNADVIALVGPHMDPKVNIIHADALEWQPPKGQMWDVIWHDIWPDICLDDCDTRAKLSRRYARKWRVFHGAWAKDEIRRLQSGRSSW